MKRRTAPFPADIKTFRRRRAASNHPENMGFLQGKKESCQGKN
jgi:hypothetical protein